MEFNTAYMCVCKPTPAYVGDLHRTGDRGRMNLHARYLRISRYSLDAQATIILTHKTHSLTPTQIRLRSCKGSVIAYIPFWALS